MRVVDRFTKLPEKLNALAGPESPILEFFYTVSSNTAVADPQIKAIFQPAQVLVDPNATARFIGPGNTELCECAVVSFRRREPVQSEPGHVAEIC